MIVRSLFQLQQFDDSQILIQTIVASKLFWYYLASILKIYTRLLDIGNQI